MYRTTILAFSRAANMLENVKKQSKSAAEVFVLYFCYNIALNNVTTFNVASAKM